MLEELRFDVDVILDIEQFESEKSGNEHDALNVMLTPFVPRTNNTGITSDVNSRLLFIAGQDHDLDAGVEQTRNRAANVLLQLYPDVSVVFFEVFVVYRRHLILDSGGAHKVHIVLEHLEAFLDLLKAFGDGNA